MNTVQLLALSSTLKHFAAATGFPDAWHHALTVANFISNTPKPWSRATLSGHLTASAWVLDRTRTHAAMIHHRKLNRWLQPGGHIEGTDASWRAAAQREVSEETGLARFIEQANDAELFDVDVHPIPARTDEPAHFHHDLRFLFIADVDATANPSLTINAEESLDCRWFSLAALAKDAALGPSMRRMMTRSREDASLQALRDTLSR